MNLKEVIKTLELAKAEVERGTKEKAIEAWNRRAE